MTSTQKIRLKEFIEKNNKHKPEKKVSPKICKKCNMWFKPKTKLNKICPDCYRS